MTETLIDKLRREIDTLRFYESEKGTFVRCRCSPTIDLAENIVEGFLISLIHEVKNMTKVTWNKPKTEYDKGYNDAVEKMLELLATRCFECPSECPTTAECEDCQDLPRGFFEYAKNLRKK